MKKTNLLLGKALVAMTAVSVLSACSNGFQSGSSPVSGSNNSASAGGGSSGSISNPDSPISKADMSGYVDGGDASGAMAVKLDSTKENLIVSVPLTVATFSATVNLTIPQYPDIQIYTSTDANFNSYLYAKVPLKYILKGVAFGSNSKLPNGQPLPFFADGEAPSTGFVIDAITNVKLNLYVSAGCIGVFVSNSNIPSYLGFTYPIKNAAKTKIIGAFSLVPKTVKGDGGFYVAAKIPDEIAKVLNDYLGL